MCAPTCRGGAYLAASVFVYRSLLLIVSSISCGITGYKMTYLNVPYLEEFMLHLIYFIPLFTASGFALMGIEECSFKFVFFSSLALFTTLFVRYGAELTYIYTYDWSAFRLKVPNLVLNIILDSIFILIMLVYAYRELRDPEKKAKAKLMNNRSNNNFSGGGETRSTTLHRGKAGTPGSSPEALLSSSQHPLYNSNIHNEFEKRKHVKNSNLEAVAVVTFPDKKSNQTQKISTITTKGAGVGHGRGCGESYYPITPRDNAYQNKPSPSFSTPGTIDEYAELDDISLPPHIPLASPEFDYV